VVGHWWWWRCGGKRGSRNGGGGGALRYRQTPRVPVRCGRRKGRDWDGRKWMGTGDGETLGFYSVIYGFTGPGL
jgi:hypothetical protein